MAPGSKPSLETKGVLTVLGVAQVHFITSCPINPGGPAQGWVRTVLRKCCYHRLLGKGPDKLTKFLLCSVVFFFKIWVELTLTRTWGCLLPSLTGLRGQTSLYFILSHSTFTGPRTHSPSLFFVPEDVTTAPRGPSRRGAPHPASPAPARRPCAPRPAAGTKRGGGRLPRGSPAAAGAGRRPRARRALTRQFVRLQPGLSVQPADDKVVGEATGHRAPAAAAAAAHGAGAEPGRAGRSAEPAHRAPARPQAAPPAAAAATAAGAAAPGPGPGPAAAVSGQGGTGPPRAASCKPSPPRRRRQPRAPRPESPEKGGERRGEPPAAPSRRACAGAFWEGAGASRKG